MTKPTIIDNSYLGTPERTGLIYSAQDQLLLLPDLEGNFANAAGYISPESIKNRLTAPTILGHFAPFPEDGKDIYHPPMVIKRRHSWDVGIPDCLAFALPLAQAVTLNVLTQQGPKAFFDKEILFLSQRNTIEPGKAGRKNFTGYHKDTNGVRYIFSDKMPTQFEIRGEDICTDENALSYFGPTDRHRATFNKTAKPIRRTFGNFYVLDRMVKIYTACNAALDTTNTSKKEHYRQAAIDYMQQHPNAYTPLSKPKAIGTQPTVETA